MPDSIRVLLVDDQALLREGLRLMFELSEGVVVVGEASNGQQAVDFVTQTAVDVILMDVQMPQMNGVEATRLIREQYPDTQVIILTTFDNDEYVFDGLRAGAIGYLLKDASSDTVLEAVRAAARGETLLDPSVANKVIREFNKLSGTEARRAAANAQLVAPLTDRELDVLDQLIEGKSNRAIAEALFLSEGTVKNYVSSILSKLDVEQRTQAALKAKELGLG